MTHTTEPPTCPACGGGAVATEPVLDEDDAPTGALRAVCEGCGYDLGEIVPEDTFQPDTGQEPPTLDYCG